MENKGKIICAYSGSGKSYYCKTHSNCVDLDSRWFLKKDGWEEIYIMCAKALTNEYDYVFLTAHTSSLEVLNNGKDIEWYLVYPNKDMKEEIKQRLLKRNEQEDKWVEDLIDFYDKQIYKYDTMFSNAKKIKLNSGQYIDSAINIIEKEEK